MTPPPPLFHAFLRPAVLQILRAAGFHGARTSVLDSITDLAARYFLHLCQLTALYATHNSNGIILDDEALAFDFELGGSVGLPSSLPAANGDTTTATNGDGARSLPTPPPQSSQRSSHTAVLNPPVPTPTIVDVRMALQRVGALLPEKLPSEQAYLGEEDMRGVDAFIAWAMGPVNREIKRIALDGNDEATDYLDGGFHLV
jgi:transcription initiation factor TFIID subunit 3